MNKENQNVEKVQSTETNVPKQTKKPLDVLTLDELFKKAITENAESRTERYELYKDRNAGTYKQTFLDVCSTYAYLAKLRRPDAEIVLTDEYGEIRRISPCKYVAPSFLYDVINFSDRVYFSEEDQEMMNYMTSASRESHKEGNSTTILAPEEILAFWRDYNSTNSSDKVQTKALTKVAMSINDLPGIMVKDNESASGYVIKKFTISGTTKLPLSVVEARLVTCESLSNFGREQETTKIAALIHKIATTQTVKTGDDADDSGANNTGE